MQPAAMPTPFSTVDQIAIPTVWSGGVLVSFLFDFGCCCCCCCWMKMVGLTEEVAVSALSALFERKDVWQAHNRRGGSDCGEGEQTDH